VRNDEYGLGIDIGDDSVVAAICRDDGAGPEPLRLGEASAVARAAVVVSEDGRVRLDATPLEPVPPGADVATHVMARVGAPTPLCVGGRGVAAAELVAGIVDHVRAVAEAQEGRLPSWTVLAVPPSWGGHRRALLAEALETADGPGTSLVSGALAATHEHVAAGRLPMDATVAVFDLGASTLDTAVVGPTPDVDLDHLAVPPAPVPWGGRDIDDALLGHVLRCLDHPREAGWSGGAGALLRALRQQTVAVKEALSSDTVAQLDTGRDGISLRVTREELDDLIEQGVQQSVSALRDTIAGAGLATEALDGLVLAGGSARVPLVAERLSADFGRPLVVGAEPEFTSALGAARLAAEIVRGSFEQPDRAGATQAGATRVDDTVGRAASSVRRFRGRHRTPVPRPATSTGPRKAAGSPTSPGAHHRASRVLVVVGMFAALVVLVPTVGAMLSADQGGAPSSAAGTDRPLADNAAAEAPTGIDGPDATATGAPGAQVYAPARTAAALRAVENRDRRQSAATTAAGGNPGTRRTSGATPTPTAGDATGNALAAVSGLGTPTATPTTGSGVGAPAAGTGNAGGTPAADPTTQPPTQPPTEPSTQPPTQPPSEPSTQPPTQPPTEPSTQPPTAPATDTGPASDPPAEPVAGSAGSGEPAPGGA
jgi:hypothetical protein